MDSRLTAPLLPLQDGCGTALVALALRASATEPEAALPNVVSLETVASQPECSGMM